MTDIEYLKEIKDLLRDTADKCWGCNFFDIEEEECKLDKCPLYDSLDKAISALEEKQTNTAECDRNICLRNEYNGISCDECEVNKTNTAEFRISNAVSQIESAEKLKAELTAVIQRYVDKHEKTNTAEWITYPYNEVKCSNCDYELWGNLISSKDEFKYCPQCGSRMKGENP